MAQALRFAAAEENQRLTHARSSKPVSLPPPIPSSPICADESPFAGKVFTHGKPCWTNLLLFDVKLYITIFGL